MDRGLLEVYIFLYLERFEDNLRVSNEIEKTLGITRYHKQLIEIHYCLGLTNTEIAREIIELSE